MQTGFLIYNLDFHLLLFFLPESDAKLGIIFELCKFLHNFFQKISSNLHMTSTATPTTAPTTTPTTAPFSAALPLLHHLPPLLICLHFKKRCERFFLFNCFKKCKNPHTTF